ncbi:MAG: ABC transporter permease [Candidatus Eisenbacteria bacterium]|nr:ABC transporter permease [Candidatus Eisenbacteria bacterium]
MSAASPATAHVPPAPRHVSAFRVFQALLMRDLSVARREVISFLLRTTFQPLLFVVVFGYLLPRMGFMQRGYGAALLPGILGVSLAFASLQSVTLPMVMDFGWTKEIEDRLLAPVPTWLVAFEKVVSGIIQGVFAALFVLPIARLIMGPIDALTVSHAGALLAVTVLGAATFSTLGLVLGTAVEAQQIGLMFSVILAPMLMFGCAYYPWRGLDHLPVMKYGVLINPLVYVAEGLRAVLTPSLPHMPLAVVLVMLTVFTAGLWWLGLKTFMKKAVG